LPITLVTGGASSGKSKFALSLLKKDSKAMFVATGVEMDDEMKERIKYHKSERPENWETIEEPVDLVSLFENYDDKIDTPIIIDCLTFWVSNLMFYNGFTKEKIANEAKKLSSILSQLKTRVVVVTNELGMGIVPAGEESRVFRKVAGEVNQIFAEKSECVYFVVSGVPLKIKPSVF